MNVAFNYGFWDFWARNKTLGFFGGQPVTFDGENKLILVNQDVTYLKVDEDIYSNWKEWVQVRDNSRYLPAFSVVGGDPITETVNLGNTFFLENGWRIKPYEGDYVLTIDGNIYTREPGQNPAVSTSGVSVNLTRSNLTETTIAGGNATELRLREIWQILGLDEANPQVITNNSIKVGNLILTIDNPTEETTTVARTNET